MSLEVPDGAIFLVRLTIIFLRSKLRLGLGTKRKFFKRYFVFKKLNF